MIARPAILGALAAVLLCPMAALAADEQPGFDFAARWGAWGEIGGTYGTGQSSYGEIGIFAPLWQSPDSLVFTDIRGKVFETELIEGNVALGGRHMLPSGWNLGAWGALDVRRTASDNVFGQVSGGLEALSEHFDARLNGYLPFTGPQTAGPGMADVILDGNNILMVGGREVPLAGVDAEIGARVPFAGNAGHVGVYGGGFWFGHEDAFESVAGGKARVELALNDVAGAGSRFSAQYEFVSDTVRGGRHLVGARLRIPLGASPPASEVPGQWLRMADRIERDVDIVIGQSGAEAVEDAITGVDFEQVAEVGPSESVSTASTNAGANKLLILNGTRSGPQELNGNQTLQGGGSTILVRGLNSGAVTGFMAPGAAATLNDPGDATNLTLLDSNTHVAGLDIQGAGKDSGFLDNIGILGGSDKDNIAITQTSVTDTGLDGIHFDTNNSNVLIADTTLTDVRFGIQFNTENSNVAIARTRIRSVFTGIGVGTENNNVTVADTFITDTDNNGIVFGSLNSTVTISGVTVTDAGSNGITFFNENRNVTISGTTVASPDGSGIFFNHDNDNVDISGATVTGAGGSGIVFGDEHDGVTIAHATITDAGETGIFFRDDNSNVAISGTSVVNATAHGIYFEDNNSNVNIASTTITNVGSDGISFGTGNNGTIADTSITNASDDGIEMGGGNTIDIVRTRIADVDFGIFFFGTGNNVTIADTTITDATFRGLLVASDEHTIAMDRTVFAGNFDKVIEIYFTSNALSGANNSAANAYIQFCDASPQLNGTFFAFDDDGTGNPATCPR